MNHERSTDLEAPAGVSEVLDLLPQALALVDGAGRMVHVNAPFAALVGRPRRELTGTDLKGVVAEECAVVAEVLDRWRGSAGWRPGGLGLHAGGGELIEVQCRGARLPGTDLVVVEVSERVTAVAEFAELSREVEVKNLRRMEARLHESLAELGAVNRRLEAVNAELEQYTSMVSHDVRTPFNAIGRFAAMLDEEHGGELPAEGREMLAAIGRLAERGEQVTAVLLSLARIGAPAVVPEGSDTNAIAAQVRRDLQALIEEAAAELTIGELPPTSLQPVHLERVLTNLLTNSLKYASPERDPAITLEGRQESDVVRLTVSDNGVGVTEQERERIFEPLVRGAAGADRPGTGLGLATCRKIVESYGGRIAVLDAGGVGTTIEVTLPAAGDPTAAGRSA